MKFKVKPLVLLEKAYFNRRMLMWIYFFTALISPGCVVYYFETTLNKVNQKQLMILIFTALSNISHFLSILTIDS